MVNMNSPKDLKGSHISYGECTLCKCIPETPLHILTSQSQHTILKDNKVQISRKSCKRIFNENDDRGLLLADPPFARISTTCNQYVCTQNLSCSTIMILVSGEKYLFSLVDPLHTYVQNILHFEY